MTNQDIISLLQKSVEGLTKATSALGDKAAWSPLDKGRSAGNQVAECAFITAGAAQAVEAGAFPTMDMAQFGPMVAELGNQPEKALAMLADNSAKLCAALEACTPEKLETVVTLPWGEQATLTEVAMIVHWNNTYHEGQINYISTLVD
jgi:hypothetical protein